MTQAVDNDSIARADPLLCLYPTGASPPCFSLTLTTCNWKSRVDDDDDAKVAQVRPSLFFFSYFFLCLPHPILVSYTELRNWHTNA